MKGITFTEIENSCRIIAEKIKSENQKYITLAAVSRGGLIPATIIAHLLGIKEIRFIRLSSYSDDKKQSDIIDTSTDIIPDSPQTYIIDDICDTGATITHLRQKYPSAKIYTLINKNPTIKPDFFALSEPAGLWINFPWKV